MCWSSQQNIFLQSTHINLDIFFIFFLHIYIYIYITIEVFTDEISLYAILNIHLVCLIIAAILNLKMFMYSKLEDTYIAINLEPNIYIFHCIQIRLLWFLLKQPPLELIPPSN